MVELDWNQNWGGMATKQLGQLALMANRRRDQLDERTSRLSRHEMTQRSLPRSLPTGFPPESRLLSPDTVLKMLVILLVDPETIAGCLKSNSD